MTQEEGKERKLRFFEDSDLIDEVRLFMFQRAVKFTMDEGIFLEHRGSEEDTNCDLWVVIQGNTMYDFENKRWINNPHLYKQSESFLARTRTTFRLAFKTAIEIVNELASQKETLATATF